MKKTQSINLGGKIFVLEEDAYLLLSDYLSKVREHIGRDVDADEVMSDIEISMSEKMQEKLSIGKEAVDRPDIESLISVMGTIEDFRQNFDEGDPEGRSNETAVSPVKRLYRDIDDKVIAGVCSGIAAYFGLDPFLIRILFLVPFLFGGGVVLPLYLAFWLIIPAAQTTTQKLEMKGEAATISSISRSRKEKLGSARSEEPSPVESLLRKAGRISSYLLGLFLVIGSLTVIFGATTGAGIAYRYAHDYSFFNDVPISAIREAFPLDLFVGVCVLLCTIPAFATLVIGSAIVLRKKIMNSAVLVGLIAVWIFFGFGAAYLGMSSFGKLQDVFYGSERVKHDSENVSLENFDSIVSSGRYLDVKVVQGEEYSLTARGRKVDLEGFSYEVKDGVIFLSEKDREIARDCLACHQETVEITVTAPDIKNLRTDRSDVAIDAGFPILGIDAKDSSLRISGKSRELSVVLEGSSLDYQGESDKMTVKATGSPRSNLSGKTGILSLSLQEKSILSALDLYADSASLNLSGESWVAVNASTSISGAAKDDSGICYLGAPDMSGLALEELITPKRLQRISSYDYSMREDRGTKRFYDGNHYYLIDKGDENAYAGEAERIERVFGA